jgi:hypothetical protein
MKRQKQILSHRFDCGKESISGDFIANIWLQFACKVNFSSFMTNIVARLKCK